MIQEKVASSGLYAVALCTAVSPIVRWYLALTPDQRSIEGVYFGTTVFALISGLAAWLGVNVRRRRRAAGGFALSTFLALGAIFRIAWLFGKEGALQNTNCLVFFLAFETLYLISCLVAASMTSMMVFSSPRP